MEQFTNSAATILNGSITSGAASLVVNSASGFPTTGNFRIIIDQEILLVTSVAGTTFNVTRGQETTAAAAHNNGVPVTHIITSGGLAQTIKDRFQSGTAANRPSATGSGILYFCTDIPVLYLDDPVAVAWKQFATEYMPAPATAASYTAVGAIVLNQLADVVRASSTGNNASTSGGALIASGSLGASSAWSVTLVTSAALNFVNNGGDSTIAVAVSNGTTNGTSTCSGVYVLTSNANWGLGWITSQQGGGTSTLGGTFTGAPAINYGGNFLGSTGTGRLHMRLLADGTNLHYQYSMDGYQWMDLGSAATPSGLTDYGFLLGNFGGAAGGYTQALIFENTLNTAPLQYTITNNTNANPSVVTIGTHTIQAGDVVAIHGATANLNSGTGQFALSGGWVVTAVGSTTITVQVTSTPATGSAGTVTLLSR